MDQLNISLRECRSCLIGTKAASHENWPRYLYALDEYAAGATFRDIGGVLLGIEDYDDAAKRGGMQAKAG